MNGYPNLGNDRTGELLILFFNLSIASSHSLFNIIHEITTLLLLHLDMFPSPIQVLVSLVSGSTIATYIYIYIYIYVCVYINYS